jgi:hypothetical protein
LPEAEMAQAQ